ncbi:MAG: hypothetical protein AAGH88_10855 [Planctomycetota bacterium]
MNGPDYIVEIDGLRNVGGQGTGSVSSSGEEKTRPWIAVTWQCCSVYSRIYRNRAGTAYEGQCPKCGKPVKARVGPGGTDSRFFQAG